MRTIEYNFGIPLRFYIRVNFAAAARLIDLAGGVEIYNDRDIDDPNFPMRHTDTRRFGCLPAGISWMGGLR
jgi:anionic cell wall polymer biosynthesis LytR-Cps2A-Psr (LCP) family protein